METFFGIPFCHASVAAGRRSQACISLMFSDKIKSTFLKATLDNLTCDLANRMFFDRALVFVHQLWALTLHWLQTFFSGYLVMATSVVIFLAALGACVIYIVALIRGALEYQDKLKRRREAVSHLRHQRQVNNSGRTNTAGKKHNVP